MKNLFTRLSVLIFSLSLLGFAATARANTPSLYVSSSGNSITLTINNASPNTPVYLYQRQSSSTYAISNGSIGTTDSNGNATLTQTVTFDGSSNPINLYVMVNGVSFPDPSSPLSIPPGTCSSNCSSGTLTLSQTSVSLNSPQSATVIASPSSGSVTITNNSNSSVANAFTSGDSIIITGQTTGSATLTVCSSVSTNQCNSILVTVNGGSATTLNFSNSNPVVTAGQSSTVTIYSPSNSSSASYYVSSNSNSNAVTNPSISGSTLYFSGGTPGNATLNICQTGSSFCGSLPITVGSNGLGGLSISPSSLTLTAGNTGTAAINNTTGALTIANNSNNAVVSASVSNASGQTSQTVTVYAIAAGASTLTICPTGSTSGCVYLYAQVGAANTNNTGSGVSFSLPNPIMTVGQSQSIAIYSNNNATSYTISNNTTANIVSLSLSGSSLYLVGQNIGSSTVTICQISSTICGTLNVTVNGTSGGLTFNPSNANVAQNQSQTLAISGGSGSYYISSNTNPSTAAVSLQGNSLYITGLNSGNTTVTICQSNNSSVCGAAAITVGGSANSTGSLALSNPSPAINIGQTQNITISGGSNSSYYISSISNPTVAGINITGSNLRLTGNAAGNTTLSVCQTGNSTCASLTVTVTAAGLSATSTGVSFITAVLPDAVAGQSYNFQIQAQGGNGSYTYSVTSGGLPSGLSMSAQGLVAGTPIAAGSSNVTITATDSSGAAAIQALTLAVNSASTQSQPSAAGAYPNGELISENKTIYIVYQNTKVGFASAAAFTGLGYNFSNVVAVANSGLTVSPKVVKTAIGHPRGAWILSGSTVYFVTPAGLIGVPDWNTFTGNGGQASFITKATAYDLTLPKLSKMLANDARLQP